MTEEININDLTIKAGDSAELEPCTPVHPDDMPQVVKSNEELPELELSTTAAAMVELIKMVSDTAVQAAKRFVESLKTAVSVATIKTSKFAEAEMYYANDNPRWWHLYKNAKKARIRKKYRRRLMNQLLRKLKAADLRRR